MNRSYAVPPFALEIRVGSLEQRLNLVFAQLRQKKHFLRCPVGLLTGRFQVIPERNFFASRQSDFVIRLLKKFLQHAAGTALKPVFFISR